MKTYTEFLTEMKEINVLCPVCHEYVPDSKYQEHFKKHIEDKKLKAKDKAKLLKHNKKLEKRGK